MVKYSIIYCKFAGIIFVFKVNIIGRMAIYMMEIGLTITELETEYSQPLMVKNMMANLK